MQNKTNYGEFKRQYNVNRPQYLLAKKLLEQANKSNNIKILDVGCGMGEFIDLLKKNNFRNVQGLEGAHKCHNFTISQGHTCSKVNLEKEKFPFKNNQFDIVVSLEVIEHLWNTQHYLTEIKRILKNNGCAIFTTPNYNHYTYRMKHLLGNFESFTYLSRHKKFYTCKSFEKEIERHFYIKTIGGLYPVPFLRRYIYRTGSFLKNLLSLQTGILCSKNRPDLK